MLAFSTWLLHSASKGSPSPTWTLRAKLQQSPTPALAPSTCSIAGSCCSLCSLCHQAAHNTWSLSFLWKQQWRNTWSQRAKLCSPSRDRVAHRFQHVSTWQRGTVNRKLCTGCHHDLDPQSSRCVELCGLQGFHSGIAFARWIYRNEGSWPSILVRFSGPDKRKKFFLKKIATRTSKWTGALYTRICSTIRHQTRVIIRTSASQPLHTPGVHLDLDKTITRNRYESVLFSRHAWMHQALQTMGCRHVYKWIYGGYTNSNISKPIGIQGEMDFCWNGSGDGSQFMTDLWPNIP